MMAFIWIALVYVIVAFTDITAGDVRRRRRRSSRATAQRSIRAARSPRRASLYLALAVLMGVVQRFLKPPLWLLTVDLRAGDVRASRGSGRSSRTSFVLARAALGAPHPRVLRSSRRWCRCGRCCSRAATSAASCSTRRSALGVIGILFGGYEIEQPAFKTWDAGGLTGTLFPFLFVTIACGACSGFHGLVCSGTTSKQIARESHMRPVGYGAMLAEGFVALIALVTVMIVAPARPRGPRRRERSTATASAGS